MPLADRTVVIIFYLAESCSICAALQSHHHNMVDFKLKCYAIKSDTLLIRKLGIESNIKVGMKYTSFIYQSRVLSILIG